MHKSPRNKGVCLVSKKLAGFTLKTLKDTKTSADLEPTLFDGLEEQGEKDE